MISEPLSSMNSNFKKKREFPSLPVDVFDFFLRSVFEDEEILASMAVKTIKKPYGINSIIYLSGSFGISFVSMRPGATTSLHYHHERAEYFFIRKGILTFYFDQSEHLIQNGKTSRSIPGQPHRLSNCSDSQLEILEIFTPPNIDDKIRVEDFYGRTLGSVSHKE